MSQGRSGYEGTRICVVIDPTGNDRRGWKGNGRVVESGKELVHQ